MPPRRGASQHIYELGQQGRYVSFPAIAQFWGAFLNCFHVWGGKLILVAGKLA